jgi:hypothetical protein
MTHLREQGLRGGGRISTGNGGDDENRRGIRLRAATAQQVDRRYKSDQARQKSKSLTGIKLVRHLVLATPY